MVINDQGAVTEAIMYQPYGTMSDPLNISTPDIAAREKFTGKEYDEEGANSSYGITGMKLNYFGARFLDPETGGWTSTDPADEMWNAYSYCGGDPVNLIDPDGEDVADDAIGFGTNQLAFAEAATENSNLAGVYQWMIESSIKFSDAAFGFMLGASLFLDVAAQFSDNNWNAFMSGDFSGAIPLGGVGAIGRAGKQARLFEYLNDANAPSYVRGWIQQDVNAIENGTRQTVRVPPSYDLAHKTGFEARKGFGYKYSDLKLRADHQLQHKIQGYK
jgi:RHS repeat-associated protein